ncbi:hypothetical protein [Hymenobacter negativus]|uniref:Uncharacterized protein n=1 Tax=Hymenobacter negativus TaxID=2795026 RepID=A0ABS3QR13_9BACT|nr:hypothetical protein [Hymenobacter negativus]MBO2013120.1 hypothetical protein [Hymenobacter negativus]
MKPLARFFGAALVGAFALLATPAAQAQVGVNINIGVPAWGPQVPYGTQYYYIPEIDGYYDLYNQQYIVYQDGYWVPLPELYGYDPYQFHPVIVDYRGAQPWSRVAYYRQHYAYQPYRNYGPSRAGYYNGGYGYGPSYGRPRYDTRRGYSSGRDYSRDYNDRNGRDNRGGYSTPRTNQLPQQQPQPGGYNPGQGQGNQGGPDRSRDGRDNQGQPGNNGGGRGNSGGGNHGGGRGRG